MFVTEKRCSKCKQIKNIEDFYVCKTRAAGHRSSCKVCMDERSKKYSMTHKESVNKHKNKYRNNNSEKILEYRLKYTYDLSLEKYNSMREVQRDLCAICGRPERFISPKTKELQKLTIDHCHRTGKIRGLLCRTCNSSLGKFQDSIEMLKSAISYLEKYNKQHPESPIK